MPRMKNGKLEQQVEAMQAHIAWVEKMEESQPQYILSLYVTPFKDFGDVFGQVKVCAIPRIGERVRLLGKGDPQWYRVSDIVHDIFLLTKEVQDKGLHYVMVILQRL